MSQKSFNSWSTASQVLKGRDLSSKVAIVTGSNSGIGLETAKSLALAGCEVIFACRNEQSTLQIIEQLRTSQSPKMTFIRLDLASLRSCAGFCDSVKRKFAHIDFLILNAGVFGLPYTRTEDGLEATFQVCHLSHFFVATRIADLLGETSRVILVASESHRFSNLPSSGLRRGMLSVVESRYSVVHAYNNVKLCNVLFACELRRRWYSRGIAVFAVHPGNFVSTDIQRHSWLLRLLFVAARPFTKSLQQAAATTVLCAVGEELSGVYYNNCTACEPSAKAISEELAKELWRLSEEMIEDVLRGE